MRVEELARAVWHTLPVPQRTWARIVVSSIAAGRALPLAGRLTAVRQGFTPETAVLYGLRPVCRREYLTERDRELHCGGLNGPEGKRMLDDKAEFGPRLRDRLPDLAYRTFGRVEHGQFHPEMPGDTLESLAGEHGRLVVKPRRGRKGQGVVFLTPDHLDVSDVTDAVVTEFLEQHPYSSAVFPLATNTIRVLMLRDDRGPFAAAAVHRFGTASSAPADNFSAGGVSTEIDLTGGRLGVGVEKVEGGRVRRLHRHPDTGTQITGTQVPGWDAVIAVVVRLGEAWPFLRHLGWDLVVTEQGVKVIEGNNQSDVDLLQVHRPLMRDERTRAFYAASGVIR